MTTPLTITSVVGMQRTLGAVSPQSASGQSYVFASWSDGGAASHTITTAAAGTTYTASYQPGFAAKINFQPAGLPVPAGYQPDTGDVFGARGNGQSYGWNVSHTDVTRDRNVNADQRLDTLSHLHAGAKWEFALPNGTYDVLVTVGDAAYSSTCTINVEGVSYWSALPLGANQFASATQTVTVSDGRLTIDQGAAADKDTRIDYIEITAAVPSSGPFTAKINFQPAAVPIPPGYQPDTGDVFGARGGGLSYGWNVSHTDVTRDRNINSDQRLDTLCHMHAGGRWEIAVPNGTYDVLVSVGDPGYSSTYTLNVEGVNYWTLLPLGINQFASLTKTVTVSDGRLTVDQGAAADKDTRLDYLEIRGR